MTEKRKLVVSFDEDVDVKLAPKGPTLTAEKAKEFSGVMARKVTELSRKEQLSRKEGSFINSLQTLSARHIQSLLDLGYPLPDDDTRQRKVSFLAKKLASPDNPSLVLSRDPLTDLSLALGAVAETRSETSVRTVMRPVVEDLAIQSSELFADMVSKNGGIPMDAYLQDSLQSLTSKFDLVEQEQAARQEQQTF